MKIAQSVKDFGKFAKRKVVAVAVSVSTALVLALGACAVDDPTPLETFVSSVTTAVSAEINLTTLSTVLLAGLGIALPLFVAWFVFRRIKSAASAGLRKGKI